MSAFDVKFSGVKEFEKQIKKLTGKAAKKVLKSSLKKGASVIVKEARRNLPSQYRTLKKALRSSFRRPKTQFYQTVKIGFTVGGSAKYDGWYAHIVEGGSKAHAINAKTGKMLSIGNGNFAGSVNHPGTPARPFLRPAFDNKSRTATSVFTEQLWKGIRLSLKK